MPGAQIVCPGCDHPAREHGLDVGCVHGWIADPDGCGVIAEGCRCSWAHIGLSPAEARMEVGS